MHMDEFMTVIFIILLLIIPYLLGCSVKAFVKDRLRGAAYTYVIGAASMWLVFGVLYLLLRPFHAKLWITAVVYGICLLAVIAAGVIVKGPYAYMQSALGQLKFRRENRITYLLFAVLIVLVCLQIYVSFLTNEEGIYRDSEAVYEAVQIYSDGELGGGVNVFTGQPDDNVDAVGIFSAFPAWIALLGVIFRITPLTVVNVYIPLLIIPLVYMSYYLFAVLLFGEKHERYLFLIMLAVVAFFSNYALYVRQSIWNLQFMNCWDPDIIVCNILLPLVWYLSVTAARADKKVKENTAKLNAGASDRAYREALQNRRTLKVKKCYIAGILLLACFMSVYGAVMCSLVCMVILLYYFLIRGYDRFGCVKRYCALFIPALLYIAAVLIISAAGKTLNPLGSFWASYADNLKSIFDNNFETNMYLVVFIIAMLCHYVKKDINARSIGMYIPLLIMAAGVFNPLIYLIFGLLAPDYNAVLFWCVPINAVISYAAAGILLKCVGMRRKLICAAAYFIILSQFMPKYNNFNWQSEGGLDKIPDEAGAICAVIEDSGFDKKVIALDDGRLCETLRLCDSELELYYYAGNQFAYGGDTSMYVYVNQEEPYLQGIVSNAKRAGYNYVILSAGKIDPNWASVLYHIWPVGAVGDYEIYSIGYF